MQMHTLYVQFNHLDKKVIHWLARNGLTLLRISLGVVFLWFGALKVIPGLSPAEGLIRTSMPFLPMDLFLPFLALWEMLIGLGFISGKFTRLTVLLMLLQMVGTISPLFLRPDLTFTVFPVGLTIEGEFIIKNLVLISAALVIAATARGGGMVAEPQAVANRGEQPAENGEAGDQDQEAEPQAVANRGEQQLIAR
jgi:uncharacterized membrane protein YkgB